MEMGQEEPVKEEVRRYSGCKLGSFNGVGTIFGQGLAILPGECLARLVLGPLEHWASGMSSAFHSWMDSAQ